MTDITIPTPHSLVANEHILSNCVQHVFCDDVELPDVHAFDIDAGWADVWVINPANCASYIRRVHGKIAVKWNEEAVVTAHYGIPLYWPPYEEPSVTYGRLIVIALAVAVVLGFVGFAFGGA